MVTSGQRHHLWELAVLLNEHAEQVLYQEVRPMVTRGLTESRLRELLAAGRDITCDCSESVTLMFRLAGLADPNGLGYDGFGYTGTMLDHLPHFKNIEDAHVGTLIVFGSGTGTHVVMVTKRNGQNPHVYSHGSHAASAIWDLDTERTYHPGEPLTLLEIQHL